MNESLAAVKSVLLSIDVAACYGDEDQDDDDTH